MKDKKIPLILQAVIFLIPLNIYIIGDWMGSGIQTLFFRYMQTNMGNSLIFLDREIGFIIKGQLTGKSALVSEIWLLGVVLICIATALLLYAVIQEKPAFIRYCSLINIGGAVIFALSIVLQYGIMLNGPAGFAIPLGIPVIFCVAYLQYQSVIPSNNQDTMIPEEDGMDEEPENP